MGIAPADQRVNTKAALGNVKTNGENDTVSEGHQRRPGQQSSIGLGQQVDEPEKGHKKT